MRVDGRRIPADLKAIANWLNWRLGPPRSGSAKRSKLPVGVASGSTIDHTDPTNFATYAEAVAAYHWDERLDGLGFSLADDGKFFLDLDDCRDPVTGEPNAFARLVLESFRHTYAEVSPTGTGYRIIGYGVVPPGY